MYEMDHVPTMTLLARAQVGSTTDQDYHISTDRLRERIHTALVTCGNINPSTLSMQTHQHTCSVVVPMQCDTCSSSSSSSSSGGGNSGGGGAGAVHQVVVSMPPGVVVSESVCTPLHVKLMSSCVNACLGEVRQTYTNAKKHNKNNKSNTVGKLGVESSIHTDVSFTHLAAVFP